MRMIRTEAPLLETMAAMMIEFINAVRACRFGKHCPVPQGEGAFNGVYSNAGERG